MACLTPLPSARGRRLFELLEEQQEPFLMDKISLKRRRGGLLKCMLTKFLRENSIRKALKWDDKAPVSRSLGESLSCTATRTSKMNDDGDGYEESSDLQFPSRADGEASWKCIKEEDSKQLSPVSVLGMHSCEGSPVRLTRNFNGREDVPTMSLELQSKASDIFEELLQVAYTPAFDQLTNADVPQPDQPPKLRGKEVAKRVVVDSKECSKHNTGELGIVGRLTVAELSSSWRSWNRLRPQVTVTGVEVDDAIFGCMIEETVLEMLVGFP